GRAHTGVGTAGHQLFLLTRGPPLRRRWFQSLSSSPSSHSSPTGSMRAASRPDRLSGGVARALLGPPSPGLVDERSSLGYVAGKTDQRVHATSIIRAGDSGL